MAITLLFGLAYPLVVTGVSQVAFHDRANGSLIERDGRVVGSRLLAQDFGGEVRYFQPRRRRRPAMTPRRPPLRTSAPTAARRAPRSRAA